MPSQNELVWKAYAVKDTKNWSDFEVVDFTPKIFSEDDVDIKIEYCGVCGSDVHTITGGWGNNLILPLITGHEIIGTVHRVGSKVTQFREGDRVGVGAQVWSCGECDKCANNSEQYCDKFVYTYNNKYPNGDIAHGGYATAIRVNERFVFPIPAQLSSDTVAPLMCAGLAVFSPLKRNGAGSGKVVGIVGVGGLGHLAIQFANAMGAEVVVFSHTLSKKEEAMKLGAHHFVVTSEPSFVEKWNRKVDMMIDTADVSNSMLMSNYLKVMRSEGIFIALGLPDEDLPPFSAGEIIYKGLHIGGSLLGSKKEALEMLTLAAEKGIKAVVQELPMKECGIAVRNVKEGTVRFRHVLKMDL